MDAFVKTAIIENGIEAQLVESVLTQRHIPHRIRSYYDTAYDGLFQLQKGWGAIYAEPQYEEEIHEILKSIRKGGDAADDAQWRDA